MIFTAGESALGVYDDSKEEPKGLRKTAKKRPEPPKVDDEDDAFERSPLQRRWVAYLATKPGTDAACVAMERRSRCHRRSGSTAYQMSVSQVGVCWSFRFSSGCTVAVNMREPGWVWRSARRSPSGTEAT